MADPLLDPFEKRRDCRPIRRAFPDVVQGHPPHRIHEDVAAQLVNIARGASQPMTSGGQLNICPPGRRSPDRQPPPMAHPVGPIEGAAPVNQQGPPETVLAHVLFGALPSLERHDYDAQVQRLDLVLMPPQLRQVLAAGQSEEVPVEDHQQPVVPILLETINGTGGVLQRKRDGGRPDLAVHLTLPHLSDVPASTVPSLIIKASWHNRLLHVRAPAAHPIARPNRQIRSVHMRSRFFASNSSLLMSPRA